MTKVTVIAAKVAALMCRLNIRLSFAAADRLPMNTQSRELTGPHSLSSFTPLPIVSARAKTQLQALSL